MDTATTSERFRSGRRALAVVAAFVAAATLAGCSDDEDPGTATTATGARASSSAAGTPALGASPSPGATAPDLPVLASRKSSDNGIPVQVDLNEVRVSGRIMQVTYTARNLFPLSGARWQVADFFSDGVYQKLADGTNDTGLNTDGVFVVDTTNAKRYLVARDPMGLCVCSTDTANTFVAPQQGVVLSATFGAPPASVTTVDVSVVNFGTFAGVKITR